MSGFAGNSVGSGRVKQGSASAEDAGPLQQRRLTRDISEIAERMEVINPKDVSLVKFLGSGGYGEVYLGKWHSSEAAIKCLNPSLFYNEGQVIICSIRQTRCRKVETLILSLDRKSVFHISAGLRQPLTILLHLSKSSFKSSLDFFQGNIYPPHRFWSIPRTPEWCHWRPCAVSSGIINLHMDPNLGLMSIFAMLTLQACLDMKAICENCSKLQVSEAAIAELIQEADLLGSLRHPNVVWVYGIVLPDMKEGNSDSDAGSEHSSDGSVMPSRPSQQQGKGSVPGTVRPPAIVTEFMSQGSLKGALQRKADIVRGALMRVLIAMDAAKVDSVLCSLHTTGKCQESCLFSS